MGSLITKYLSMLDSLNVGASIGIFYSCFADFSFTFNNITLNQIDEWIEHYPSQNIKDAWIRQRTMKHPDMIFLFMMMDIKDKTIRSRNYQRNTTSNNAILKGQDKIVKSIQQDMAQISTLKGIGFLGELIGAWMLTCPESLIRNHADKSKNWQPHPGWLQEVYPDTLGKNVPTSELELLFILDYYFYDVFELILHHNTMD